LIPNQLYDSANDRPHLTPVLLSTYAAEQQTAAGSALLPPSQVDEQGVPAGLSPRQRVAWKKEVQRRHRELELQARCRTGLSRLTDIREPSTCGWCSFTQIPHIHITIHALASMPVLESDCCTSLTGLFGVEAQVLDCICCMCDVAFWP